MKTPIRNYYNQIIGYLETLNNGDQIGRDFYNRIIAKFDSKLNITRDFYGRIVGRGNLVTGLIYAEDEKQKSKRNVNKTRM